MSERERIIALIFDRLEQHVERIEAIDWDYFAACRYRPDASQAVSDVARLRRYWEKLAAEQTP